MVGTQICVIDTFRNTGNGVLTIDSVANLVPSIYSLTLPSFPIVLQPDSSQTFTVCATPQGTGPNGLGTINVYTKEIGRQAELAMSVYGIKVADTVAIGTSLSSLTCDTESATVSVTNTGNWPDTYTASIGGTDAADFTITSSAVSPTLESGGFFIYTIRFTPSKVGSESAQVTVTRTSDGAVSVPIDLSGTGGAATIAGSDPAPMTAIGSTSGQFTVTVNNTGSCPWTTGVPTVDPQFSYVSGATTIAPNGSAPFVFTYSPTVAGGTSYPVSFPSSVGLSTSVNVSITTATDGVAMVSASNGYSLGQTYPNPFNDESNLEITVAAPGLVQLSVVDVQGNVVEQVLNRQFDAGTYSVTLSAEGLASGTYYYQMSAGGVTLTRQMVIVK
jgi:hypothetical protein